MSTINNNNPGLSFGSGSLGLDFGPTRDFASFAGAPTSPPVMSAPPVSTGFTTPVVAGGLNTPLELSRNSATAQNFRDVIKNA